MKYRGVSLPIEMLEAIERIIKENPEFGYSSIAEFIKDAIRNHIAYLESVKKEGKVIKGWVKTDEGTID